MQVYGLSGKSGTGKSYQALNLCRDKGIDAIIDDGLFIVGNAVIAGKSAKRQATMVGAIKTALLTDGEHRQEVKKSIEERKPASILIIGTSDQMVEKIAKRLELPEFCEIIQIEEITTEKDRETARVQRKQHGKHVIPAATFQLKQQFSGYFLNPLKMFQQKMGSGGKDLPERSVVRPTYSYLGKYVISGKVISDILVRLAFESEHIKEIYKIIVTTTNEGIKISADIYMDADCKIKKEAEKLQREIALKVEYMTAFNVMSVTLTVRGLV